MATRDYACAQTSDAPDASDSLLHLLAYPFQSYSTHGRDVLRFGSLAVWQPRALASAGQWAGDSPAISYP